MGEQDRLRRKAEQAFNITCFGARSVESTDPVAAMWLALVYTIYASKENHTVTYKQLAFGTEVGVEDLWQTAKAAATAHARKAVALAKNGTPTSSLATRILEQAEALDSSTVPRPQSVQAVGGYPASHLPHPMDAALVRARLTHEQFLEAVKRLPDHNILSESAFAKLPDLTTKWKTPAVFALVGAIGTAFLCRNGFTWWAIIPGLFCLGGVSDLKDEFFP